MNGGSLLLVAIAVMIVGTSVILQSQQIDAQQKEIDQIRMQLKPVLLSVTQPKIGGPPNLKLRDQPALSREP